MRRSTAIAAALLPVVIWCADAGRAAAVSTPARPSAPAPSTNSSLTGVACFSATGCAAVGFATIGGVSVPLAESWNGKAWTVKAIPHPAGFGRGLLSTVACSSATSCTAVGWFDTSKGAQLMLAVHWNGTAWAVQATPAPAGYYGQSLSGVACPTATTCFAVGTYFKGTGAQVTLTEYWNGRSWAAQTTPTGTARYLTAVSCTSDTACTAVGSFSKGGGSEQTLVERWNGKTWALETGSNPNGSAGTYPLGLSCASATSCLAVGNYQTNTAFLGLAERWNGTVWRIEATPKPGAGDSAFLSGADCSSAAACGAVGYSQDAAGNTTALAEGWNGRAWAPEAVPSPSGATASSLYGESCSSSTACTAVGAYQKGSGSFVFAERWNGKTWAFESLPNG